MDWNQQLFILHAAYVSIVLYLPLKWFWKWINFPVGGCRRQWKLQEKHEAGKELGGGKGRRRSSKAEAPRQGPPGDGWRGLVPEHAPTMGHTAGQRHQEVSSKGKIKQNAVLTEFKTLMEMCFPLGWGYISFCVCAGSRGGLGTHPIGVVFGLLLQPSSRLHRRLLRWKPCTATSTRKVTHSVHSESRTRL